MVLVAQQRSRVRRVFEFMAEVAFHMYRAPAQVAALDEPSHASRDVAELVVVSHRELEAPLIREGNEDSGLLRVERERLLHIDVASPLETGPGDIEMAFRRRRDVNDVWSGVIQQVTQVAEIPLYREPLVELPRHQRFAVTDPDDLAATDSLDLRSVSIGDLTASDDGDSKHAVPSPGSSRNSA